MINPLRLIVIVRVRVMCLASMSLEGLAARLIMTHGVVLCWSCLLSLEHLDLGARGCVDFHGDGVCQTL